MFAADLEPRPPRPLNKLPEMFAAAAAAVEPRPPPKITEILAAAVELKPTQKIPEMFLRCQHQRLSEQGEPSRTKKSKKDPDKIIKKHPGKIIKKRRTPKIPEPQRIKMEHKFRKFFTTNVQTEEGREGEDSNGDLSKENEERLGPE